MSHFMLPKIIKIACFDVNIIEWEKHTGTAANRWGEFSAKDFEIRIETSGNKFNILNTFIHELNHAIYWLYNIEDEDKEERIVSLMAVGLCQVIRDNPEVLSFINSIIDNK